MKKLRLEIVKLNNNDVVATSSPCISETLINSKHLTDLLGGQSLQFTGSGWDTGSAGGAYFYDKNGNYLGHVSGNNEYQYFIMNNYYHATVGLDDGCWYYIECNDPSHH